MAKTRKTGRSAITGRFQTVSQARKQASYIFWHRQLALTIALATPRRSSEGAEAGMQYLWLGLLSRTVSPAFLVS